MKYRMTGTVEAIVLERPGAQEIEVRLDGGGELRLALNLIDLSGRAEVGDTALLNTTAVEMGLGTGGFDFVISLTPSRLLETPPGHILKLRYTPLQHPILATEASESLHHASIARFQTLAEIPVVCIELHSQLAGVCTGVRWAAREHHHRQAPRVVYIMTDGATLPIVFSRLIPALKEQGLLFATITAGNAFGGDYEAINLYSALAIAKEVVDADIIVVGQGPGSAGTATHLGFSGIDQGLAVNAAASLGGVAILTPRISFADSRQRHRGLSHHTHTILTSVVRAPLWLPIPRLPMDQLKHLSSLLETMQLDESLEPIIIDADQSLEELETIRPYAFTMGRGIDEERAFFLTASASGIFAVQLAEVRSS